MRSSFSSFLNLFFGTGFAIALLTFSGTLMCVAILSLLGIEFTLRKVILQSMIVTFSHVCMASFFIQEKDPIKGSLNNTTHEDAEEESEDDNDLWK